MSHSNITEQFIENLGIMSEETYNKIINCKIMIVGLGGLGGYLANHLVRLGVNHLTLVDYDRYTLSNLNRQLFSSLETVGKYKAEVIKEHIHKINPQCMIEVALTDIKDID
ncbi:MAG: ThiF family adenylyltransferase, partial [Acholeplasmataceae bacterium]|nr:ThiF family adenylyltransferase [Acholeplasmataceae bacterium]